MVGAHIIKDYFSHYAFDYTQSVYIPEVAIQHAKNFEEYDKNKQKLSEDAGLTPNNENRNECLMVQMIKQLKDQQQEIEKLKSELNAAKQNKFNSAQ